MKNNILQILMAVSTLVVGAGAEEILPRVLGVGFPALLAMVHLAAVRLPMVGVVAFALAAGGLEDGLSATPRLLSASYFLLVALTVRRVGFAAIAVALTYPAYQIWLAVWTGACTGAVFGRILLSIPFGLMTGVACAWIISFVERKAAINEVG